MKILYISFVPHKWKKQCYIQRVRDEDKRKRKEKEGEEGRQEGRGATFKVISFKSIVGNMSLLQTSLSATQTFLPSFYQFMHRSDKRAHWFCFGWITIGLSLVCGDRHHSKLMPYISYFWSQKNHALIYRFERQCFQFPDWL